MIDWLLIAAFVVGIFVVLWIISGRKWRRKAHVVLSKRPNPTKDDFIRALDGGADRDVAEWFGDVLQAYCRPVLAPHPDDHFVDDLSIDPDEPTDWLLAFCKKHNLRAHEVSDWPVNQPLTVRNFAVWLSTERKRLRML